MIDGEGAVRDLQVTPPRRVAPGLGRSIGLLLLSFLVSIAGAVQHAAFASASPLDPATVDDGSLRHDRLVVTNITMESVRLTVKPIALVGEPVLLTIEILDEEGRVTRSPDAPSVRVDLSDGCVFKESTVEGGLLEGAGSSSAWIAVREGRARVLISSSSAESVDIRPGGMVDRGPGSVAGSPTELRFLLPDSDEDVDGLTNLEEMERGSNPLEMDSDADDVSDPEDNCPVVANSDQSDVVHPNRSGDACDDPDRDGVSDLLDSCPERADFPGLAPDADCQGDGPGTITTDDEPGTEFSFQLPFAATDVVFDPGRPYAYVSHKAERMIYFVNLTTGLIDKQFSFDLMPESLALTPDGARLFVALLTREHSSFWWDEDGHEGYIASFDLTTQVKDREFRIAEDPFDLLATSDGHLVVASGSGQWTHVRVFDAVSGAQRGVTQGSIRHRSRLALHPSERIAYVANTDVSPSDILRLDLLPGGGIGYRWDSPYHGDHRINGNVWASPLGDTLVTRGGDVFTVGSTADTDMQYLAGLSVVSINDLAWDAVRSAIVTGEGSTLRTYNLRSRLEIGSQAVPGVIDFVGIQRDQIGAVLVESTFTRFVLRPHPALAGATNTAPVARVAVNPASGGTTMSDFRFDASSSTDAEDGPAALRFRWDFDGDGVWDTSFASDPVAVKRFATAGTRFVRLQVRDSLALVGDLTQEVGVTFESDPGAPGPVAPEFQLPFAATDVVFDPRRPYVYVSHKAGKKVFFVNLTTGLIEKQFSFDLMPESLALTPDGSRLFAALLTREHSSVWWDEDGHEGYIASFDLAAQVKDRQFRVIEDPYDLLATSDGHLVVASGSGQWTHVRVFDAVSGAQRGVTQGSIRHRSRLALHPAERMVYGANTDVSPSDIFRLDLLPAGGIAYRWDSPYHGGHRMSGNVWASPLGDMLVTRGGDIFSVGSTVGTDMRYVAGLSVGDIDALVFDAARQAIFTGEGSTLRTYNLRSHLEIGSQTLSGGIDFIGVQGERLYAVLVESAFTRLVMQPHPALAGATNTAPLAIFTVTPASGGTTMSEFRFDASSSTDAEDALAGLRFRWDFDGDGTWDTSFASDPVAVKRFSTAGTRFVRLQVRDGLALVGDLTQEVDVTFESDPGLPGPASPPFELPFIVTDVVFDPGRPYAYVSHKAGKKVFFVNLTTGFIEKQFSFELMPESLALTPDGARLFVALLTREHSSFWWDEDGHEGYIASFDLAAQVKDRQFRITEDPIDLLATSDGHLVVASGSGQSTHVRVFDAVSGAHRGATQGFIYQGSRLTLHPSERIVYGATNGLSPSDIFRLDLLPGGGIAYRWDSPYHGDRRMSGNVWASPFGDMLVTRGGDIFTVGTTSSTDMRYLASLSTGAISDLAWDAARGLVITLEGSNVRRYRIASRDLVESTLLPANAQAIGRYGPLIFAIIPQGGNTLILRMTVHNRPPVPFAGLDMAVECSAGGAMVSLDASASSDPDSLPGTTDDIVRYDWLKSGPGGQLDILATGREAAVFLPLGVHTIRLRVSDRRGVTVVDDVLLTVEDTLPPVLTTQLSPEVLWPPDHRMVAIQVAVSATDQCSSNPTIRMVSAVSSEPDDEPGTGDGETVGDIQGADLGVPDLEFLLRAERTSRGPGRSYVLTYAATDAAGLTTENPVTVVVPHDLREAPLRLGLKDARRVLAPNPLSRTRPAPAAVSGAPRQ